MLSSFNGYISAIIEIFPYVCYMAVVGWVVGVWNWSLPFIASTDTRLRPFVIVLCFLIIARSVLRLPFFFLVCESLPSYFFCLCILTVLTVKFTVFQLFYLSSHTAKHPLCLLIAAGSLVNCRFAVVHPLFMASCDSWLSPVLRVFSPLCTDVIQGP